MQTEIIKPLLVYSASAGSGKTFSLVQNYLKLTLSDEAPLLNFSKILAMTFTNKAAWEMKERIIEALDFLAYPIRQTEKETKKAKDLLNETLKNIPIGEEKIQKRAKRVLSEILHHYEDFNVLTIDKFSLRLIRTFSRDLELEDNFEVTLDQDLLLEQVIDELLSKIGKEGEEEITNLALTYAKSKLYDGNSWNIRRDLILFSKVLTNETDQEFVNILLDKDYSKDTRKEIMEELEQMKTQFAKQANEVYSIFNSLNSTSTDYPGGKVGIFKLFSNLQNADIINFGPPNKTTQKVLDGDYDSAKYNVDPLLLGKTHELFKTYFQLFNRVYVLEKLRENFYNLALLKYISKELNAFKERENLIGIFEFGQMIAELLKREKAPYVYERLGNRYNHYLLDEFQDTSRLQWMNLVPLVHESISQGHDNLIVGDPKQAIYRFRNGLVEQFVALPSIYNPEEDESVSQVSQHFKALGEKVPLEHNYRSKKAIIEFNNNFFKGFLESLTEDYSEYYADIEQIPVKNNGGYVEIERLEEKLNKDDLVDKEYEFILKRIKEATDDGFYPGDICILSRKNSEGGEFAKRLTEDGYKVVSSDSLLVSSDTTVNLFIDYLNLRRNTKNKALQIKFSTAYYQKLDKDPVVELAAFWKDGKIGNFDFKKFVVEEFESLEQFYFPYENLYDLGSKLIALLGYSELKNPYLHHLMDLFQDYDLRFGPDIRGFIEHWKAKLNKSSIQMPENNEAIRIMTIHKSKGLEFPVVILPNLNWPINPSRNEQFVKSDDGELLYAKLSKNNVPEFMLNEYENEYRQDLLDQLNTLYVAFTRPSERLYIHLNSILPKTSSPPFSSINQSIAWFCESWDYSNMIKRDNSLLFGERSIKDQKSIEDQGYKNFSPSYLGDFLWFPELALQDEDAKQKETFNNEHRFGNQLHKLLEKSKNGKQLQKTAWKLYETDELDKDLIPKLIEEAQRVFDFLNQQDFSKNAEQTLEEQGVLISETEFRKLDKIFIQGNKATVVDFKTGEKNNKHQNQVKDYCHILSQMGYEDVKGYLLYTREMELINV